LGNVRVGIGAFFRAEAGNDLITACIDLGLVYKTDPLQYMHLPEHVVSALYRRTLDRLKSQTQETDDDVSGR
jgi:hypothetical protein